MEFRLMLIIDFFKPKFGWESRKKVEKEITRLREKIRFENESKTQDY